MPTEFDRVAIFIGGVQKGGTTSLHSYFSEHSCLLAPRKKETHFLTMRQMSTGIVPTISVNFTTGFIRNGDRARSHMMRRRS